MTNEGTTTTRQSWETPSLRYVGHVVDVVLQGGGKLTATGGDPGEPRKQRPIG